MAQQRTGPKKRQSGKAAPGSVFEQAIRPRTTPAETVSGRWLLTAMSVAILGAAVCAWGALCLLFWQGSWQLLYHPTSAVTRTPASVGLAFDAVGFATSEAGAPQIKGWWIPAGAGARYERYTVLYLHGQNGNLSDTVDDLAMLHELGLNVLAFDYRGYGQSVFERPSEKRWLDDANSALTYLTETRHLAAGSIVLDGKELGANLTLEIAAHPELAGAVVEEPLDAPMQAVFGDARARMVPAHLLVRDRWDSEAPVRALKVPSLWFAQVSTPGKSGAGVAPEAYGKDSAQKMLVWLKADDERREFANALGRWLDDLPSKGGAQNQF